MANEVLSIEQMAAMLDNVPVAVFVSEVESRKLLYANRLTRELFPGVDRPDAACYTVAGFEEPCSFCRAGKITRSELMVREYHHPHDDRIYQLSGKLIDWGGREAHIEYILDVTEKRREEQRLRKNEQELRTIFDNIACGLCIYQAEGEHIFPLFHNRAFYRVMGYSEANIRSVERETNYLNVHPGDVASLKAKLGFLIQNGGVLRETYRLWNDREQEYRWIHLVGTLRTDEERGTLLYCVYSDVSEQKRLERELTATNEKMEDIINAIPGGVAIYQVSDILRPVYFSDGVPELTGYTVEEYRKLIKGDALAMTYPEDTAMVEGRVREAVRTQTTADFEFRKLHRDGHVVWVHVQARQIGEEDGEPLLQCVFHNISTLKETQRELDHLVNSIPGGIASYRVEGERLIPIFISDGVPALSGHTREEYAALVGENALDCICKQDRPRVLSAVKAALDSGAVLDVSYRVLQKNGMLTWIHLNGRRMGPRSESTQFYAVFTNLLADVGTLNSEMADGVYIINKENYELLFINETKRLSLQGAACVGQTCYAALHGLSAPCAGCTLRTYGPDEQEHQVEVEGTDLIYTARVKETVWNGIPAYVQYIRDVTEEVHARREKERLEMYFQTLIKNLPGGIAVVRCTADGGMTPEFISEGFAAMTQMTVQEAEELYCSDAFRGIHPDDTVLMQQKLFNFVSSGEEHCELTARFLRGDGSYIWVRDHVSMLEGTDGVRRLYCIYTDITQAVKEREQLRRQFEELILQHYRTPGPDTLILGHCNITGRKILDIWDSTHSDLLETFGRDRDAFFIGLAGLVVDQEERQAFLDLYLTAPSKEAFARKETERKLRCFVKLPKEDAGRYVQFKVNMVEAPDTGDATGILSATDVTDQTISEEILHRLSVTSHEYVIDLDFHKDFYKVLARSENASQVPGPMGCYSQWTAFMSQSVVVPRDREAYARALSPECMERRLRESGAYTVSYLIEDETGGIRAKNITVSAIDLRLGRVSLVCTDTTSSVREQQSLLSMLAYTFELAGMINVDSGGFVMYTREIVLKNLPPFTSGNYNETQERFVSAYVKENQEEVRRQLYLETMLQRLKESPNGYEFVLLYQEGDDLRYKQINVLWGDRMHETVCIVRADVTETLAAERQAKDSLKQALASAEEANRAKSDFLSAMSHDIRTPMNAIMGMTALAAAHLDDRAWMEDCLRKISISSKHLLSLINDVLDMSRIERSQLTLNRVRLSVPEMADHLAVMMAPQAEASKLRFTVRTERIFHPAFYGDSLRVNQILINLLSNAIKFTPEGGRVELLAEEIPALDRNADNVRYRFTVSDTGMGMTEGFLQNVFDPFVRDQSAARFEGTGLGLSIVHGLVELMQGEISVESRQGEGSAFRVELEFQAAQTETGLAGQVENVPAQATAEGLFDGRCFLIAEDNVLNAEILCELLRLRGAQTQVERDGIQAVRAFREASPGRFSAILMDIQMPNMNGYDAARAIRAIERPDAREIPIIALTANAFAEDVRTAAEAGMTAHVAKPIDVDVLQAVLRKALTAG